MSYIRHPGDSLTVPGLLSISMNRRGLKAGFQNLNEKIASPLETTPLDRPRCQVGCTG